jgi:alpha-beta hydrolase superfamily lysophospholipase
MEPDVICFASTQAGDIFVHRHVPRDARGVVLFFHGLGGHGDTYTIREFCGTLASRHLAAYAWDMPHHGRSCSRGTEHHPMRPFVLRDERALLCDAHFFVTMVASLHPGLPMVLAGQSLGAGIVLRLASEWNEDVPLRGVLAINPIVSCPLMRWGATNAFWLASLWRMGKMVRHLPRGARKKIRSDPLVCRGVPTFARCAWRILDGTVYERISARVVMTIGTSDKIVTVRDVAGAVTRCDGTGRIGSSMKVFVGGSHELLWETDHVVWQVNAVVHTLFDRDLRP